MDVTVVVLRLLGGGGRETFFFISLHNITLHGLLVKHYASDFFDTSPSKLLRTL